MIESGDGLLWGLRFLRELEKGGLVGVWYFGTVTRRGERYVGFPLFWKRIERMMVGK